MKKWGLALVFILMMLPLPCFAGGISVYGPNGQFSSGHTTQNRDGSTSFFLVTPQGLVMGDLSSGHGPLGPLPWASTPPQEIHKSPEITIMQPGVIYDVNKD